MARDRETTSSGARRRPRLPAPPPPGLELHLLGGFDALLSGAPVAGFESRKVRALLAYVALQGERAVARDELAALFWPDLSAEGARRNLRQAIYNVRSSLGDAARCLTVTAHDLRLDPRAVAVDAIAFQVRVAEGVGRRGPAAFSALSAALELYRGELLAGLQVGGADLFEEWLAQERERLRELAVDAAGEAMRRAEVAGHHPNALRFARRLGELEPLSEEACRARMRLLARLGRRAQAIAQFEELADRLDEELGVVPGDATRRVWEAIRSAADAPDAHGPEPLPAGPVVPLVGRERSWRALSATWGRVRRGEPRLTLVLGDPGAGKTRLVRSFLHDALEGTAGTVLQARGSRHDGRSLHATLAEAVCSLPLDVAERRSPAISGALGAVIDALPEVAHLRGDLPRSPSTARADARRAVADLLVTLSRSTSAADRRVGVPAVLFVDDLEKCPTALVELLELWRSIERGAIWLVLAARTGFLASEHLGLLDRFGGERLALPVVSRAAIEHAAATLVGKEEAQALAKTLVRVSAGLPVALTEAVNLAADSGRLRPGSPTGWNLADSSEIDAAMPADLEQLIDRRLELLPTTSRRLLGLASVVGDRFHTDTLLAVDREHPAVLDAALAVLVERWMVRPILRTWTPRRRDRDIVLWASGARLGPFEFAQRQVRERIYSSMDLRRREQLHRAVAQALTEAGDDAQHDEIARHWLAGGDPGRAARSLEAAARWRRVVKDDDGAVARLAKAKALRAERRANRSRPPE